MQYPKEFVEKCKAIYPDWKELHEGLANGSDFVGRYLDDSRYGVISTNEILKATSLEELQAKAHRAKAKEEIYGEWGTLYQAHLTNQRRHAGPPL